MSNNLDYIIENYQEVKKNVQEVCEKNNREEVKILAVSKTFSLEKILELYKYGVIDFGENYAQELKEKNNLLLATQEGTQISQYLRWHFIGHLQTNKVKYIAEYVYCIHSVDSLKLANEISRQAERFGRQKNPIRVLLQVHTSGEAAKSGISAEELNSVAQEVLLLQGIQLVGLMTITQVVDDPKLRVAEFKTLKRLLDEINQRFNINLTELSMGMSDDYPYAIENGSTILRIGTAIFGKRKYNL